MTRRVAVIVPAYQAEASIGACLRALEEEARAAADVARVETLVVDDASRDGTASIVRRDHPRARLLRLSRNVGADAARNEGLAATDSRLVAFIDADCEVRPGWLAAMVRSLGAAAPAVMGRVVVPPEFLQRALAILELGEFLRGTPGPIANFATLNVAFDRDALTDLRFDAPPRICGDRLLSWALHRRGVPIAFAPDMALLHRPDLGSLGRIVARRRRYASAFVRARRRAPTLPGARLVALGPVGAPFAAAGRLLRDLTRLLESRETVGIAPLAAPAYGATLAAFRLLDALFLLETLLDGGDR